MTYFGNTYKGANGTFTGVRYKRDGAWFGGVHSAKTGKRTYGVAMRSAWDAAGYAEDQAKIAAGEGAEMVLDQ